MTLRLIESHAAAVAANSRFVANQFNGNRCPVTVVPNPVDCHRFDPDRLDRAGLRRDLGLSDDAVAIVVVGYLAPLKGQDDAIRVLSELKPRHPSLRLLILGSVKYASPGARFDSIGYGERLERMAREMGLEQEVLFLGEREDVPEILRAADLALVPSWYEGFGRTVLEAMAMRLPVIATDVGGPAEIISDGCDGILLPPREPARWARAVGELLGQPKLRAAMGQRARERASRDFTLDRHVERVTALYDEVLNGAA